jgi:hypothetical protein
VIRIATPGNRGLVLQTGGLMIAGRTPRCRIVFLLLALSVVSHARQAVAEPSNQTTTAMLQGSVRDASHAVLPGATVTLREENTGSR